MTPLNHSPQIELPPIDSGPLPGVIGPLRAVLVPACTPLTYTRSVVPS